MVGGPFHEREWVSPAVQGIRDNIAVVKEAWGRYRAETNDA